MKKSWQMVLVLVLVVLLGGTPSIAQNARQCNSPYGLNVPQSWVRITLGFSRTNCPPLGSSYWVISGWEEFLGGDDLDTDLFVPPKTTIGEVEAWLKKQFSTSTFLIERLGYNPTPRDFVTYRIWQRFHLDFGNHPGQVLGNSLPKGRCRIQFKFYEDKERLSPIWEPSWWNSFVQEVWRGERIGTYAFVYVPPLTSQWAIMEWVEQNFPPPWIITKRLGFGVPCYLVSRK